MIKWGRFWFSICSVSSVVISGMVLTGCQNMHAQDMVGNTNAAEASRYLDYANNSAGRKIGALPQIKNAVVLVHDGVAYVGLTLYWSGPISNYRTAGTTFIDPNLHANTRLPDYFLTRITGGNTVPAYYPHYTGAVIGKGLLERIDVIVKSADPRVKRVLITSDVPTTQMFKRLASRLPSH